MAHDYLDPNCNTQQKWSNHGPYENLLGLYERLNKYGTMGYGSNICPDFLTTFHEFLVLFMQWQNFNTTTYSSEFRLWYEILLAIGSNQVNVLLPHTVMLLTKESDTTTWKLPLCGKNDIYFALLPLSELSILIFLNYSNGQITLFLHPSTPHPPKPPI